MSLLVRYEFTCKDDTVGHHEFTCKMSLKSKLWLRRLAFSLCRRARAMKREKSGERKLVQMTYSRCVSVSV